MILLDLTTSTHSNLFHRQSDPYSRSACELFPLTGTRRPFRPNRSLHRWHPVHGRQHASTWPFPSKQASRCTHRQCDRPVRSFCPVFDLVYPTQAFDMIRLPSAYADDSALANQLPRQPELAQQRHWEMPDFRCCWTIVRRSVAAEDPLWSGEHHCALWD